MTSHITSYYTDNVSIPDHISQLPKSLHKYPRLTFRLTGEPFNEITEAYDKVSMVAKNYQNQCIRQINTFFIRQ